MVIVQTRWWNKIVEIMAYKELNIFKIFKGQSKNGEQNQFTIVFPKAKKNPLIIYISTVISGLTYLVTYLVTHL